MQRVVGIEYTDASAQWIIALSLLKNHSSSIVLRTRLVVIGHQCGFRRCANLTTPRHTDPTCQGHRRLFTSNTTLCFQALQLQLLLPPCICPRLHCPHPIILHPPRVPSPWKGPPSLAPTRVGTHVGHARSMPAGARSGRPQSARLSRARTPLAHRPVFPPHTTLGHDNQRGPLLAEAQTGSQCVS